MRSALLLLLLAGCARDVDREARALTGGDPQHGTVAMLHYGCGTCHEIDGVPGAVGKIGPPLDGIAQRMYLAGELPNVPANLERWIIHPRAIHPRTVMPEMGVTESDARDIAAYLYTLH